LQVTSLSSLFYGITGIETIDVGGYGHLKCYTTSASKQAT
jgi:hypothetical protein